MPLFKTNSPRVITVRIPRRACWLHLFIFCVTICIPLFAQEPISKENQVKAVFLYNFTQFVQWPETAFATGNSPMVIGILGEDPFGNFIDALVQGEVIAGHPIRVERFATVEEARSAHVLYINISGKERIAPILETLRSSPVLTVSDRDNFARSGGIIGFSTEKGRIAIRINLESVTNSGLVISSKLLRLSEIVAAKNN